jgi:GNAT-family acetyltransferase (TIGR03103 family)
MAARTTTRRGETGNGRQARRRQAHNISAQPLPDSQPPGAFPVANATLDCGWGRLLFGQTFADPQRLASAMRAEAPDRRDIAMYVRDPHVMLAVAPQELFLDPSHTFRLDLSQYRPSRRTARGFTIRRLASRADADAVNRIYAARNMVTVPPEFFWEKRNARAITYFVAEDNITGAVIGTVTGVDHTQTFDDPARGSSLWCLAVDPQSNRPGVGEVLVRRIAEHFKTRDSAFLDLSVMHDNHEAIALYTKLGFTRVANFTLKRKNPINERLFVGPDIGRDLNPYATIIVNEARRRGIHVEVTDAEGGFFRLTHGGRTIRCRESLSELTSAVALSICDDKAVTRRLLDAAEVRVPDQIVAGDDDADARFLEKHGRVVVKPARGEQGRGVVTGIAKADDMRKAIATAQQFGDRVLMEEYVSGEDLRLIVIDFRLVAAAIRRPPKVVGDGHTDIRTLIASQSRRRAAATGGESTIPIDIETERCLAEARLTLASIPEDGSEVAVRRTANLHTGGTIHDVTGEVHPRLAEAAIKAARTIDIPVVGIDFIVRSPRTPDYAFIEANERPGLANHEPQPTAERFVDLLFPLSMPTAVRIAAA